MIEDAPTSAADRLRRHQTAISVAVLAALAYVPSLTAAPGRMPTDSKLYVYLDPGRFLADTTTTLDPRQFGGWVPHQHIAYLWPTGPWFWLFETLGVPDWVAHRLWIGTLLVLAGLGVRFMARVLGFSPLAALAAGLVYQLSPYILPYVSRTSVLLLPFAGLGWIVALTVLAGRDGRWRYPAAIALVVLTVGAVNATALAMVIPAPVLWLLHATWERSITWRRALATALRTALLCTGVSLWWMMMLVIQGRHGADVLAYSESLESVSFTSTSTEVTRGLGYWLFYVRDASSAATTASLDHLVSGRTVFAGVAVVAAGLAGIVWCASRHRRFAALLFGAGVILGVGVHPIDDPSPLMSALVGDGAGGLALALRSSTRAIPVMLLGLGIGVAMLVSSIGDLTLWRRVSIPPLAVRLGSAGIVGVLAIVGLPALRTGGFVDPALERDQTPPSYWLDAAADLDARPDGYRVLQVPGSEFGAFQWGYTVDQPLPGLTERPLLTRDLLPLGSPAAMDLVFALDDRFQSGSLEPESVAVVARFLGVDTVWVSGDVSFDRFQLARPEVVTDELTSQIARDAGLGDATAFGEPVVMVPQVAMIDDRTVSDPRIGQPIAPITLVDVTDPIPTVRVKDDVVVLAGSGDGVVDAAAGGVLDGTEAVLYSASLDPTTPLPANYGYVLTDSNRDRAHHWRSSQDVTGYTESAAAEPEVLRFESGDQRLPVFGEEPAASDTQTVSIQVGPIAAQASSYGERFAYLPEHRPVMAIDGDPETSWIVADRAQAIGEFIELSIDEPFDHLDLMQPAVGDGQRTITEVGLAIDGRETERVTLDDSSRSASGQRVDIAPTDGPTVVRITITGTTTPQPPIGAAIGGVGFAEIDAGLEPTVEFIRTPIDVGDEMVGAETVDVVLTRLRTEPTDRWRDDPEPVLAREFALSTDLDLDARVTLRLDRRMDDQRLADLLGEPVVATLHTPGAPSTRGAAAFDGDDDTAWTTPFDHGVGEAVVFTSSAGTTATELTVTQPGGASYSPITVVRVTDSAGSFDVDLPPGSDAVIDLERPIDLDSVRFEIVAVDARFTQNRRFNEPTQLPAAISEILFDGDSPGIAPVSRLAAECRDDLLVIDGRPIALSFDVDVIGALAGAAIPATLCTPLGLLATGEHRLLSARDAIFQVDRVILSTTTAAAEAMRPGAVDPTEPIVVESSSRHATIDVPPCPNGCWVVYGEGFNDAWRASVDGRSLAAPTLIDANANGWWIAPTDETSRVEVDWPVQRDLNIAFALTALTILGCVALILLGARRRTVRTDQHLGDAQQDMASGATRSAESRGIGRGDFAPVVMSAVAAGLFIDWIWMLPVAVICALAVALGRTWIVGVLGASVVVGAGLIVANVVRTERPYPDAGWPVRFEWLHHWTLFGVVLVAGSGLLARRQQSPPDDA